jgi:hypothetical protein
VCQQHFDAVVHYILMAQLASGEDEFANVEKINLCTASQETKRNVMLYFDLVLSQLSTDFVNSFNYTKPQENCNEKRLNIFFAPSHLSFD